MRRGTPLELAIVRFICPCGSAVPPKSRLTGRQVAPGQNTSMAHGTLSINHQDSFSTFEKRTRKKKGKPSTLADEACGAS